jgi:ADP-ribose pyrophosphatase YjhB (NUDIX family)
MSLEQDNVPIIPIPAIGVGGILFNKHQQVLLIRRDQPPAKGLWSVPGGRLEPGESLVDCCQREFYEETNIEITVQHIVALVDRKLEGYHYVIVDFLVIMNDEENIDLKAQTDVSEASWFTLPELADMPIVTGLTEIIRRCYKSHVIEKHLSGLYDPYQTGDDFILPIIE